MALMADHPILPTTKERRYSSSWKSGMGVVGGLTLVMTPWSTSQPLLMVIIPLTATILESLITGNMHWKMASGLRMQSTSVLTK